MHLAATANFTHYLIDLKPSKSIYQPIGAHHRPRRGAQRLLPLNLWVLCIAIFWRLRLLANWKASQQTAPLPTGQNSRVPKLRHVPQPPLSAAIRALVSEALSKGLELDLFDAEQALT